MDEWIEKAQAGDAQAFDRVMREHQDQVYRVALRLVGNREDALDVTQDVFLRFYKYLHRYDPAQSLRGWLYTMTINASRDALRTRAKRSRIPIDHPADGRVPPAAPGALQAADDRQLMEAALQQLPDKERAALVLRDIEGLSTAEVAKVLRSTETTVRSQVSRARVKLRAYRDRVRETEHDM